jgi:hypothetical protein
VEDVSAGVCADVLLEPPPEAQPNSETTPKINEANSPAEIFWVIAPPKWIWCVYGADAIHANRLITALP